MEAVYVDSQRVLISTSEEKDNDGDCSASIDTYSMVVEMQVSGSGTNTGGACGGVLRTDAYDLDIYDNYYDGLSVWVPSAFGDGSGDPTEHRVRSLSLHPRRRRQQEQQEPTNFNNSASKMTPQMAQEWLRMGNRSGVAAEATKTKAAVPLRAAATAPKEVAEAWIRMGSSDSDSTGTASASGSASSSPSSYYDPVANQSTIDRLRALPPPLGGGGGGSSSGTASSPQLNWALLSRRRSSFSNTNDMNNDGSVVDGRFFTISDEVSFFRKSETHSCFDDDVSHESGVSGKTGGTENAAETNGSRNRKNTAGSSSSSACQHYPCAAAAATKNSRVPVLLLSEGRDQRRQRHHDQHLHDGHNVVGDDTAERRGLRLPVADPSCCEEITTTTKCLRTANNKSSSNKINNRNNKIDISRGGRSVSVSITNFNDESPKTTSSSLSCGSDDASNSSYLAPDTSDFSKGNFDESQGGEGEQEEGREAPSSSPPLFERIMMSSSSSRTSSSSAAASATATATAIAATATAAAATKEKGPSGNGADCTSGGGEKKSKPKEELTTTTSSERKKKQTESSPPCKWRAATDPVTGRTYYYHSETRQSQWQKPLEMASCEEREEAERKERETREFFESMEANILRSISAGAYGNGGGIGVGIGVGIGGIGDNNSSNVTARQQEQPASAGGGDEAAVEGSSNVASPPTSSSRKDRDGAEIGHPDADADAGAHGADDAKNGELQIPAIPMPRPNLVRTISTMDEAVLSQLVQRVPSHRNVLSYSGSSNCGGGMPTMTTTTMNGPFAGAAASYSNFSNSSSYATAQWLDAAAIGGEGGGTRDGSNKGSGDNEDDEDRHDSPHDVITQTMQEQPKLVQQQQQIQLPGLARAVSNAGSNLGSILEVDTDDSGNEYDDEAEERGDGKRNADAVEAGLGQAQEIVLGFEKVDLNATTTTATAASSSAGTVIRPKLPSNRRVVSGISNRTLGSYAGSNHSRERSMPGGGAFSRDSSVCSLGLDALGTSTSNMRNDGMNQPIGGSGNLLMGSSFNLLGDSTYSLGLSEAETGAMEKLVAISNEIANIEDSDEEGDDDNLHGVGLLADGDEDEAVAFHRSIVDQQPQQLEYRDMVYIPPSGDDGDGTSSRHNDDSTSSDPKEILYVPPASGGAPSQASAAAIGTKQAQPLQREGASARPALPRPAGFYGGLDGKGNVTPPPTLPKPSSLMTRRNTCGTLYVNSTMSAPDKDATIKCVCGVYRAHILQSEMEGSSSDTGDEYAIFNDWEASRSHLQKENRTNHTRAPRHGHRNPFSRQRRFRPSLPGLDEVSTFYRDVFTRAKMESDCIIMSLVYVERLIKTTGGKLRPTTENWRSILFSCMVLSSKVWDDLSMWNADFSQTCPAGVRFPLKRVNELEVAVLSTLNYSVKVLASEYAKYYFLMRSMLIKSGLGGKEALTPLDVKGAKRLQHLSSLYQSSTSASGYSAIRSKSVGSIEVSRLVPETSNESKALLEHVVEM